MPEGLGIEVHLDCSFGEAMGKVTTALENEGFSVLTKIDVEGAFKEKIGKDFRHYVIMGACNPNLAYRALSSTPEIGMMLPCNLTVEAGQEGGVIVRIVDPILMLKSVGLNDSEVMAEVAAEAAAGLGKVAAALSK